VEVHLRKHRSGGIRTLTLTAEVGDEAQFLDALERVGNLGGRVLVHTHDGGFVGIQFGDSPVYHVSVLDPSSFLTCSTDPIHQHSLNDPSHNPGVMPWPHVGHCGKITISFI
jgi:hypothetical protein